VAPKYPCIIAIFRVTAFGVMETSSASGFRATLKFTINYGNEGNKISQNAALRRSGHQIYRKFL